MGLIAKVSKLLEQEEGRESVPYKCPAGYITVGVGRNMETNPIPEYMLRYFKDYGHITDKHIDILLQQDIDNCISAAKRILGEDFFEMLSEPRQAVIISMIFQMGEAGVRGFRKTLSYIKQRRFEAAAEQMLKSKWAKQTPLRAKRTATMLAEDRFIFV